MSDVPCPTSCGRKRPEGKAMCGVCWRRVPKELQDQLYSAWRRWRRDFGNADAFRGYREALDAAVAEAS